MTAGSSDYVKCARCGEGDARPRSMLTPDQPLCELCWYAFGAWWRRGSA